MITAIQLLFMSIPYLIAVLLGTAAVIIGFLGAVRPILIVLPYFALIFYFPNNSYGLLEAEVTSNFYSRGSGMLFFPAINILLFGVFLGAAFGRVFPGARNVVPHSLGSLTLWLPLLILVHFAVGLALDVRWFMLLQPGAMLHFLNLAMILFVLLRGFSSEKELRLLVRLFVVAAVTRGLFGVVRYFLFGGDPANYYGNFLNIDVKLTFFDINDGLIATMTCFGFAHFLGKRWRTLGLVQRLGTMYIIVQEIFLVAFSFRRAEVVGMLLAALLFVFLQPRGIRWRLLLVMGSAGIPAMLLLLGKRLSTSYAGSFLERLLPDIAERGGGISFTSGRFTELYATVLTIKDNIWIGVGTWGEFVGWTFPELYWHRGNFGWMHSGVLHVFLKTGLVGLALFVWGYLAYGRFLMRARKDVAPEWQGVYWACAGGALYLIPNWLFGTPVIEFRTIQMFGIVLAIPFVIRALSVARDATLATGNSTVGEAQLGGRAMPSFGVQGVRAANWPA